MTDNRSSKFEERRYLDQFSPQEAEDVLSLVAGSYSLDSPPFVSKVGSVVMGATLYEAGAGASLDPDLIDAAARFLVKYGFLVCIGKAKWLVRKVFVPDDVDEAMEVLRLARAPKRDHETDFDKVRRLRREVRA